MSPSPRRPFQAALDAFRAREPRAHEQTPPHYDAAVAWAGKNLASWPKNPPLPSLYLMKNPDGYSGAVTTDARTLVEYANFGSAVGTWNAKGTARWACAPDEWIVADVSLVQEQADEDGEDAPGNYVDLLLAMWRVEEGWAAAILKSGDAAWMQELIGLAEWPSLGRHSEVWYGE